MSAGGPVLITGATGQVGSALVRLLSRETPEIAIAAPPRSALDLLDPESVRSAVRSIKPRWVISCAAYTAVDAAETDCDAAFAINATAPGILAEEASAAGAALIHVSTDYVFDGSGTRPWVETDRTGPLGVYGASKLAGEQAIAAVAAATGLPHVILRTSWVYSGSGKNFVRTMLRLLSTRTEPLRVVADQHGSPTSAPDLAVAIQSILRFTEDRASGGSLAQALSGVYHCAGTGETTWAGLAEMVREFLRVHRGVEPAEIIPVPTADYRTPAARPLNSRLNCGKLAETFGVRLPHWRTSVGEALQELAESDL